MAAAAPGIVTPPPGDTVPPQSAPECPICLDAMPTPDSSAFCINKHVVCKTCRPKMSECPICRGPFYHETSEELCSGAGASGSTRASGSTDESALEIEDVTRTEENLVAMVRKGKLEYVTREEAQANHSLLLRVAVDEGFPMVVALLLKNGANPNAFNGKVLLDSLRYARFSIAELLLKYGADPTLRNGDILKEARRYTGEGMELVIKYYPSLKTSGPVSSLDRLFGPDCKRILKSLPPLTDGSVYKMYEKAAENNSAEVMDWLLTHYDDWFSKDTTWASVYKHDADQVFLLLRRKGKFRDKHCRYDEEILGYVMQRNAIRILGVILDLVPDVNYREGIILYVAMAVANSETVRLVMDYGGKVFPRKIRVVRHLPTEDLFLGTLYGENPTNYQTVEYKSTDNYLLDGEKLSASLKPKFDLVKSYYDYYRDICVAPAEGGNWWHPGKEPVVSPSLESAKSGGKSCTVC